MAWDVYGQASAYGLTKQAYAEKVLYLDFDGVLHDGEVYWHIKRGIYMKTPGRRLFEWMAILEELLAPYPDVKIVLSTSWVRARNFNFARAQLSPALRARVIGATFHKREMRGADFDLLSRGAQVLRDVGRRQPRKWFAIDDDTKGWPNGYLAHLVATNSDLGISDLAVQAAIRAQLAAM
jgi:hypothetical protein